MRLPVIEGKVPSGEPTVEGEEGEEGVAAAAGPSCG